MLSSLGFKSARRAGIALTAAVFVSAGVSCKATEAIRTTPGGLGGIVVPPHPTSNPAHRDGGAKDGAPDTAGDVLADGAADGADTGSTTPDGAPDGSVCSPTQACTLYCGAVAASATCGSRVTDITACACSCETDLHGPACSSAFDTLIACSQPVPALACSSSASSGRTGFPWFGNGCAISRLAYINCRFPAPAEAGPPDTSSTPDTGTPDSPGDAPPG